eukprot:jgi/Ulvmu1/8389/UM042_0096.1
MVKQSHGDCLSRVAHVINGSFERAFDKLGRLIARRPIIVMINAVVVFGALASGVVRLENETRGSKLWVPAGTESGRNGDFVTEHFASIARTQIVYITRRDGGNVLTPASLTQAAAIHSLITAAAWPNQNPDGTPALPDVPQPLRFTDVCLSTNATEGVPAGDWAGCTMSNPLEMFGYDPSLWATDAGLLTLINTPVLWNVALTGRGFVLDAVLGGVARGADGNVTSATALAMFYMLAGNETLIAEQLDDVPAMEWEQVFLDILEAQDEADEVHSIARFAMRSFADEFGSTIDGDLRLLQVAIIGILLYTYIAISDCRNGLVGSRFVLTMGGLANIGLAVAAAYGLGGYLGLLFTPLMSILPFIMIGVGVDGMFVLQDSLEQTSSDQSMEDRMGFALRNAGTSVAIASITNFGAFLIGSNTSLPALASFSIYAAIGLLFDLILQVTFFASIMCLEVCRQDAHRVDVLCCITSAAPVDQGCFCGACGPGVPSMRLSTRVMAWLGRQYSSAPARAVVLGLWVVLLGAGIYGTTQMRVDADVNDFIPAGSYLRDWLQVGRSAFGSTGISVELYWVSTPEVPIDFTQPETQAQMDASLQRFRENEFVVPATVDSWWEAFRDFHGAAPAPADFYNDLHAFLMDPAGMQYQGDVVITAPDGAPAAANASQAAIFTARSSFSWIDVWDTTDQVKGLDSMRATEDLIPEPLGTNAFVHSANFLDYEQYKTIGREALMNIGLGFLMIAIIIIILIANPLASFLTFISVASAILELVGFMYFRGTYIDSVSVIFLVISLGLAVDYSVHVAHGYLANRATDPAVRLQTTMQETGAAVVNGATSTLIAALCLSGSGSYVFITFFYALLFIVLCGAFQGLVVLPVLLDIFQPQAHSGVIHDSITASKADPGTSRAERSSADP